MPLDSAALKNPYLLSLHERDCLSEQPDGRIRHWSERRPDRADLQSAPGREVSRCPHRLRQPSARKTGAKWDSKAHVDGVIKNPTIYVDGRIIMDEEAFHLEESA